MAQPSFSHLTLDRIGLVAQFLSFWCVACEIIPERHLIPFTQKVRAFLVGPWLIVLAGCSFGFAWWLAFREGLHWTHQIAWAIPISLLVLLPKIVLYDFFKARILPVVVENLDSPETLRRGLLVVGGIAFSLGTLCQLLATFVL